jgi:hypothetical protein
VFDANREFEFFHEQLFTVGIPYGAQDSLQHTQPIDAARKILAQPLKTGLRWRGFKHA